MKLGIYPAVLMVVAAGFMAAPLAAQNTPAPATSPAAQPAPAGVQNKLSDQEKAEGFKLLFDGTTKGWRVLGGKDFPAGWDVQDESLHHKPRGGGGDITVDETFDNFELRFDWKIAANGNSGVKYRVVEVPRNSAALGIEYQVVDQLGSADNKGKHSVGSLYDLVDAKAANPKKAGEWNESKIIVKGNRFEHWLNGTKVAEIEYGTEAWKTAFAASKWANSNPTFASVAKGNIAFQDHTDEVWYRNIRIKVLPAPAGGQK